MTIIIPCSLGYGYCTFGFLIFIIDKRNFLYYSLYTLTEKSLKYLCSIRAWVPVSFFLSLSLSLPPSGSLFHFLIVDSGPPGSSSLKDPNSPGVLCGGPAFQRAGAQGSAPPWADVTGERHAHSCRPRSRSLLTSPRGPPGLRDRVSWTHLEGGDLDLKAQSNSSPK